MRDFFIQSFEKLVTVIVVLLGLAVIIGAIGALLQQGALAFLLVLIVGVIYLIMIGGLLYLWLGIYQNTKRTADLLEKVALK